MDTPTTDPSLEESVPPNPSEPAAIARFKELVASTPYLVLAITYTIGLVLAYAATLASMGSTLRMIEEGISSPSLGQTSTLGAVTSTVSLVSGLLGIVSSILIALALWSIRSWVSSSLDKVQRGLKWYRAATIWQIAVHILSFIALIVVSIITIPRLAANSGQAGEGWWIIFALIFLCVVFLAVVGVMIAYRTFELKAIRTIAELVESGIAGKKLPPVVIGATLLSGIVSLLSALGGLMTLLLGVSSGINPLTIPGSLFAGCTALLFAYLMNRFNNDPALVAQAGIPATPATGQAPVASPWSQSSNDSS
jgi:hypothetical protein